MTPGTATYDARLAQALGVDLAPQPTPGTATDGAKTGRQDAKGKAKPRGGRGRGKAKAKSDRLSQSPSVMKIKLSN